MVLSAYYKACHFQVFCLAAVFHRKIWRQDRLRTIVSNSVDLEYPPFDWANHRGMSSRVVPHRLDEPHQVPQHGCVPAEPASVSPGKGIVTPFRQAAGACCRRSCRC